ncbi:CopG family transcriptional regulator [Rhodobacteraceae bacterium 2376]|uniref:CopG family transcriptional regulator n=1 Tax=Rhabdonatronobacter sediminivivens TaxID=2743469 RepID=A0A7Z0KZL9_9RHOB|nr:CopG family transcriptional regulator [Rhabdonatronobacter sediminivivens]
MSDRPRKSTRLTVSLEEQDYGALADLAVARDVSLSWLIRQAVRQFIERAQSADNKGEDTLHARTSKND